MPTSVGRSGRPPAALLLKVLYKNKYNLQYVRLGLICGDNTALGEVTLFKSLKGLLEKVSGSGANDPPESTPPADVLARAEAGDAEAANEMGLWYANSQPGSRKVEFWFRRAADAGLPRAQHNMGVLASRSGQTDDAIGWFRLAVAGGWRNSHVALGLLLEEQGDRKGAFAALVSGAEQGCPDAQDAIGHLALEYETEDAFKVARYWSETAAEQGTRRHKPEWERSFTRGLALSGIQNGPHGGFCGPPIKAMLARRR